MLAMQYSFTLPADYDMAIIRQRIAANGYKMDDFPLLAFKAFLHASRDPQRNPASENLYAPFYLWHSNEGMNAFLCGPGFAGLVAAFGWPSVHTWSVWASSLTPALRTAAWATRERLPIAPHTDLAALERAETALLQASIAEAGALGAVTGFDPATWTLVRFRLWSYLDPALDRPGLQRFEVGHLSAPTLNETKK